MPPTTAFVVPKEEGAPAAAPAAEEAPMSIVPAPAPAPAPAPLALPAPAAAPRGPPACPNCGRTDTVEVDLQAGGTVCSACGRVRTDWGDVLVPEGAPTRGAFWGLETATGHELLDGDDEGPETLNRKQVSRLAVGEVAPQNRADHTSRLNRKDAKKLVQSVTSRLKMPKTAVQETMSYAEQAIEGRWGQGRWIELLVAACAYAVCRMKHLPLTLPEVASTVNTTTHGLGVVYVKLCRHLNLQIPPVDMYAHLKRVVSSFETLVVGPDGKPKQGPQVATLKAKILLDCKTLLGFCRSRSLITGRQPMAIASAVLFLVARAHGSREVTLRDICNEMHCAITTSQERKAEISQELIRASAKLAIGIKINSKNLKKHLPLVLTLFKVTLDQNASANDRRLVPTSRAVVASGTDPISGAIVIPPGAVMPKTGIPGGPKPASNEVVDAMPPSFRKNVGQESMRMKKIAGAQGRIRDRLKVWGLITATNQLKPLTAADGKVIVPEPHVLTDEEDLTIERLLLAGSSVDDLKDCDINEMSVRAHRKERENQRPGGRETDLEHYLRSQSEMALRKEYNMDEGGFMSGGE